jgi:diguanylate cyclase (GGDEF)-like protein
MDGRPGAFSRFLNGFANMTVFIASPLPGTIWALYASYQLFHDISRFKTELKMLAIPFAAGAVLSALSPFTGLYYTIDSANIYHRGPLILLSGLIAMMPILYTTAIYVAFRKRMPKSLFQPIVNFSLPPLVGCLIQLLFYGLSVTWSAITVSIFIVHTGLQNRQFYLDHLTDVYNRRELDNRLRDLLRVDHRRRDSRREYHWGGFSCIMLDIDDFKSINDRHGHVTGDAALKDAAVILKSCVRSSDFIARYAGDEFVILLNVIDKKTVLQTIRRIKDRTERFNKVGSRPYRLEFSVGYEICHSGTDCMPEALIARVDALMYQEKNNRRMASA